MDKTILCVDDEVNILKLYEQALSGNGYKVLSAHGGVEAMKKIQEAPIDLVVLDIKMDGKDGLEVLGELKKQHPNLPVILHSAYNTYKADFKTWLAVDYLVKSADLTELKSKIKGLLSDDD